MEKMKWEFTKELGEYTANFNLTPTALDIKIENPQYSYALIGKFNNQNLPSQLKFFFDQISSLAEYISERDEQILKIEEDKLLITISYLANKTKQMQLPLTKIKTAKLEYLNGQSLENRDVILMMHTQLHNKNLQMRRMSFKIQEIESYQKQKINRLEKENRAIIERLNRIENVVKEQSLQNSQASTQMKIEEANSCVITHVLPSRIRKKASSKPQKPVVKLLLPQSNELANKFTFEPQPQNPNFSHFHYNQDQKLITKSTDDEQIYQLYSTRCLPQEGIFYTNFRVMKMDDQTAWVGVITQNKLNQTYIGGEDQVVSYQCSGVVMIQNLKKASRKKIRTGQTITIEVDMTNQKIAFYKQKKQLIFDSKLPNSFSDKKLYLFVQLLVEGNSLAIE